MEQLTFDIVYDELLQESVVEITGGCNAGAKFSFGAIEAAENENEDNVKITFNYTVHSLPDEVLALFESANDEEARDAVASLEADVAEILHEILVNTLDNKTDDE
jgi:hypothetical protein